MPLCLEGNNYGHNLPSLFLLRCALSLVLHASVIVAGVDGLLSLLSRFDSSSPLLPEERACILLPDMVHIWQIAILQKKKRRTVIMRKPCDLWAEPAQRLQAQKIICSRHGAPVLADDKDLQPMGGARIHSSAEELVFKRHGPPVPADNRGYINMFYINSTPSRGLKTSTSTNNYKEYERLHGPHSQCGEF